MTHADVLPPQVKAAMVLETRSDLLDAERGLREIEVLEKRGVAGAGTLEGEYLLLPLPSTPPTPSSFLPPTPSSPPASLVPHYSLGPSSRLEPCLRQLWCLRCS